MEVFSLRVHPILRLALCREPSEMFDMGSSVERRASTENPFFSFVIISLENQHSVERRKASAVRRFSTSSSSGRRPSAPNNLRRPTVK